MASSSQRDSASLTSTEPSAHQWKYDVFLSFRGKETRKGIAFEIYDGLKNRGGIETFMDDQELPVGANISPSLLKAIEESRFAIIILSPNYASSPWCLEELTKIVDCMKDENRILPLFYQLEPSDVRHQKKSFEIAFNEHEQKSRVEIEKLKMWRDALKTVANFCGWHTQNYKNERELVKDIVEYVCNKVGRQADFKSSCQNLELRFGRKEFSDALPKEVCLLSTGHDTALHSGDSIVKNVMDELRNPDTEMVLVYGIAGVGKTTVVEQVLRQADHDNLFDDMVMVRDVKQNPNLEKIQREIATKLDLRIPENHTLAERAPKLGDRIKDRRTLVVLDDVWEQIDLMAIGLPRLVNCKLLLTCRSRKDLSKDMRTQKDIPLDILNEEEAWRLFEKMAGGVVKDSGIRSVAIKIAKKCGGLPLLIVTVARAHKNSDKLHAWKETLRRLRDFEDKGLTEKAYLALEWSYDQLEDKELKSLFLLCGIFVFENHIDLEFLFKCGMGLGLFKTIDTIEEARDLFSTLVDKLKDSCLLLDSYMNMHVRMHDLVCEVATHIASRFQHVLSVGYEGELKEWPDKNFFKRCSKMSLQSSNIPMLSEVPRECPKLEMFYLNAVDDTRLEFPSNFFSKMEKLEVLGLTNLNMLSLPSSLRFLKNLQTLCLEQCELGDIALVGHLSNLETLSFAWSDIKQLPKEIGHLIRLRWLDLRNCGHLGVISPDVISRLERLEDLNMRNSFHNWEAKRGGSNASLSELKLLPQLAALKIYIPDANILPTNLFSSKLVRYQIYIGDAWEKITAETTLNTLKLKLTTSDELDQGLKRLLKRCEDLSLDGTVSVNSFVHQSDIEDFQQLKHLHLQNNVDFTYMINRKVVFPNLTMLSINSCDALEFLFSISMAKSLVELKHLKVSTCIIMKEIVSTRDQSNEKTIDNLFCKLESLTLDKLPNLSRFCTGSYIDLRLGEKLNVKSEIVVQNCLFDTQIKFPSLQKLKIYELRKLHAVWNNQLADQDSFCKLREVVIFKCDSLMNIFVPRMMGRLNALETLHIESCNSLKAVFEVGGTDVEERHADTSASPQLGPFYCQSLGLVTIKNCKSLQKIFPTSVARGLQKLYKLTLEHCNEVEEIIFGEEGLETTPPQFVFPKITSVTFDFMAKLSRFYPGMHTSRWPLLIKLSVFRCNKVKLFAAELLIFQEKHELDPLIEQPLFLIDEGSFPNLEKLRLGAVEIWYGPSPADFFCKLKSIEFCNCVKQAGLLFLHKLHNLDTLKVTGEIFVREMNSGGEMERQPVGTLTLPRVKRLRIHQLDHLLHLENHNSQSAGPLFPNLDTLTLRSCNISKNIESSAISFCNLTTLTVEGCSKLEYLTTYSVATSLVQLTRLTVMNCWRLTEIINVARNEDDHCEIAFRRLQLLELYDLGMLQRFCWGNCIVKLPSSTKLHVKRCRIMLKISSQGVLFSELIKNLKKNYFFQFFDLFFKK